MLHIYVSHDRLRMPGREFLIFPWSGTQPPALIIQPGKNGQLKITYVVTPPSVWVPGGTSVMDGTTVEVVSVTVMVVAGNVYVPAARSASAHHKF